MLFLFACASQHPPSTFLRTDYKPWNDWMDAVVSVDITNVPIGSLATEAPFKQMNIVLNSIDPDYRIALEAKGVTRRQALWMLANQYGLAMTVVPDTNGRPSVISITNREIRHENVPLK